MFTGDLLLKISLKDMLESEREMIMESQNMRMKKEHKVQILVEGDKIADV